MNENAGPTTSSIDWGADEALTLVSYGIFLHVNQQTQPGEPELLDWWHQIITAQVAIGALLAEYQNLPADALSDDARCRLMTALSRLA